MRTMSETGTAGRFVAAALMLALSLASHTAWADLPCLVGEDGIVTEEAIETLLAPGEFPGRRFSYVSGEEEAQFCLDSALGSQKPSVQVNPQRVRWPRVAGLELVVKGDALTLRPLKKKVTDEDLDNGFAIRWILEPIGQRFDPSPRFEMRIVGARVSSLVDARELMEWVEPPPPSVCAKKAKPGQPLCDLPGVSREARALALSPNGEMLAMAIGGLRPRMEMYDISPEPRVIWQSLFPPDSGGVAHIAFSSDGLWVVALAADGEMHRFDALFGGQHMTIPSKGRTARSIPPGNVMAVAGESGEVTLWYLSDGTIAWRLPPRKVRGPIDRLAVSEDGSRFATLEYDADKTVVRVWEVKRRAMLTQIDLDPYAVEDVALDNSGRRLFISHDKKGLMMVEVKRSADDPKLHGGSMGARCNGMLEWLSESGVLSCAMKSGLIQIDADGKGGRELVTEVLSADWIVAAASRGNRIVAVGEGHLLVW
jgi:hypothetical protein